MTFKDEGVNRFSDYETLQFGLEVPRKKNIKYCQISFGGYSKFKGTEFNREARLYRYGLKQLIYKRSKDGYYKNKFLMLDGFSERFVDNKEGLLFQKIYFYLEEAFDKPFVIDYLKTLFQDIDNYHKDCPYFDFIKYKPKRKTKCQP